MVIGLLLLLVSFPADNPPSKRIAGDEAFFEMRYTHAMDLYAESLSEHPDDPEILWRMARTSVCMAETLDAEQRTAACRRAESFARACVALDPSQAGGHTWLAAALGYIALEAGMNEQIALSHELLREVDIALALNPLDDVAYSIKGSLYRALGNVSWLRRQLANLFLGGAPKGGYEDAEAALKKAVALAPDVMRHHYELGVLYLDMDRPSEARAALERAAQLPVRAAIDYPRRARIRGLLAGLNTQ
jgi:tetratricopeptide (TPR) repeat protein